jgi:hypothetical protein
MRAASIRTEVLALAGALAFAASAASATPVTYRLTFERHWDESHVAPGTYPGVAAHFTPLGGATHTATPLWTPGQSASMGIEDVAENGLTHTLQLEVADRRRAGTAREYFEALSVFGEQGVSDTTFTATLEHRYVSAISMIAPSPDWFVGIWGVDLAPQGEFLSELVFDLRAWDAGTEQGNLFSLNNPDSLPRGVITPRLAPFVGNPVIGRITLTQIPEPAAGLLVGLGLLPLGWSARRRKGRARPGARSGR